MVTIFEDVTVISIVVNLKVVVKKKEFFFTETAHS